MAQSRENFIQVLDQWESDQEGYDPVGGGWTRSFPCRTFLSCCSCSAFMKGLGFLCAVIGVGAGIAALGPGAAIIGGVSAGTAKAISIAGLFSGGLFVAAGTYMDSRLSERNNERRCSL